MNRFGYKEIEDLRSRGKEVHDYCIHHVRPVPEKKDFDYLERNFLLEPKEIKSSLWDSIHRDWYAITKPVIKDKEKKYIDPDLFFVNGELQKHARVVPHFTSGLQALEFGLDSFNKLDVRTKLRSLGMQS